MEKLKDIIHQIKSNKEWFINTKVHWAEIKTLKFSEYIITINLGILAFLAVIYNTDLIINKNIYFYPIITAILSISLSLIFIYLVSKENINQLQAKEDRSNITLKEINKLIINQSNPLFIQNTLTQHEIKMEKIEKILRTREKRGDLIQTLSLIIFVITVILTLLIFLPINLGFNMNAIINFLNSNSGAIQALATLFLVTITAYYAYYTYKSTKILEKDEKEKNRPRIIIYMQQREEWLNFVDLYIENVGNQASKNINFKIDLDIELYNKKKFSELFIIKHGISNLAPKQRIKIPFVSLIGKIDEFRKQPINIEINYSDASKINNYHEQITLNFNSLVESQLGSPPEIKIKESIEKIAKSIERIDRNINYERNDKLTEKNDDQN